MRQQINISPYAIPGIDRRTKLSTLCRIVAKEFEVTEKGMKSGLRKGNLPDARKIFSYIADQTSTRETIAVFLNQSTSTSTHQVQACERLLVFDKPLQKSYKNVLKRITF